MYPVMNVYIYTEIHTMMLQVSCVVAYNNVSTPCSEQQPERGVAMGREEPWPRTPWRPTHSGFMAPGSVTCVAAPRSQITKIVADGNIRVSVKYKQHI